MNDDANRNGEERRICLAVMRLASAQAAQDPGYLTLGQRLRLRVAWPRGVEDKRRPLLRIARGILTEAQHANHPAAVLFSLPPRAGDEGLFDLEQVARQSQETHDPAALPLLEAAFPARGISRAQFHEVANPMDAAQPLRWRVPSLSNQTYAWPGGSLFTEDRLWRHSEQLMHVREARNDQMFYLIVDGQKLLGVLDASCVP